MEPFCGNDKFNFPPFWPFFIGLKWFETWKSSQVEQHQTLKPVAQIVEIHGFHYMSLDCSPSAELLEPTNASRSASPSTERRTQRTTTLARRQAEPALISGLEPNLGILVSRFKMLRSMSPHPVDSFTQTCKLHSLIWLFTAHVLAIEKMFCDISLRRRTIMGEGWPQDLLAKLCARHRNLLSTILYFGLSTVHFKIYAIEIVVRWLNHV